MRRFPTKSLKATTVVRARGKRLSPKHERHLLNSGISREVLEDRGYYTETEFTPLDFLGFSPSQAGLTPSLVIPIWGVNGKIVSYQLRPDSPRTVGERVCKYEIPKGTANRLDVPRRAFPALQDVSVPLWITEGIKKADAAVSHGLCCIALFGVHNWVTKKDGDVESTPLDDWNQLALSHRRVYVCYDSDVMTNPKVAQALRKLKNFLRSKNATVIPIYLPSKEEGEKIGLDDYLANGGTVEELQTFTKRPTTSKEPGGLRSDLPTISTHNIQLAPNVDEALGAWPKIAVL